MARNFLQNETRKALELAQVAVCKGEHVMSWGSVNIAAKLLVFGGRQSCAEAGLAGEACG